MINTCFIKKRRGALLLAVLSIILLFSGCGKAKEEKSDDIFSYDGRIQIFFYDGSTKDIEKTEILLSDAEEKTFVDSLAAYGDKLSDDVLKKEFMFWYTVKLNDNVTIWIDAETDCYEDGLTYMQVVRRDTKPAVTYGAYIDSSIIEQLKK